MSPEEERMKPVSAGHDRPVAQKLLPEKEGIDSSVPTERKRKEAKQDVQKGKP
jgi:hypothetical protein